MMCLGKNDQPFYCMKLLPDYIKKLQVSFMLANLILQLMMIQMYITIIKFKVVKEALQ